MHTSELAYKWSWTFINIVITGINLVLMFWDWEWALGGLIVDVGVLVLIILRIAYNEQRTRIDTPLMVMFIGVCYMFVYWILQPIAKKYIAGVSLIHILTGLVYCIWWTIWSYCMTPRLFVNFQEDEFVIWSRQPADDELL